VHGWGKITMENLVVENCPRTTSSKDDGFFYFEDPTLGTVILRNITFRNNVNKITPAINFKTKMEDLLMENVVFEHQ
jgi:hypothetical protein